MPERRTLNRTYSVGDQVPTCPVFTRAKIKSRFGILVNLPSQLVIKLVIKLEVYARGTLLSTNKYLKNTKAAGLDEISAEV